jgi:hypothetical protein
MPDRAAGFAVAVLNPNLRKAVSPSGESVAIPGHKSSGEHTVAVWDEVRAC